MRSKTIRSEVRKKVDKWLLSIGDVGLRKRVAISSIVTGGAIASMLLGERVNDIDIYFRTRDVALDVALYYVKQFHTARPEWENNSIKVREDEGRIRIVVQSAGIASDSGDEGYQYFEGLDDAQDFKAGEYVERLMGDVKEDNPDKYRPVFLSANAITLSGGVQIVIRFYGEPDEIHKNYDFVHCTNYWTSWDSQLVLRPEALQALLARELVYVGSLYPLCSVIRTRKFIRRGWVINAGQYLKMIMQLNALDLADLSVLEDQLIGVDAAYFHEVISKLKAEDPKKVNQAYLMEIIDRMF